MSEGKENNIKKKRILPKKPLLPRTTGKRDRLAWALQRGWLKPANSRRLTVFVIETRKGLPMGIRVRDWILMTVAWVGWGLLLFDAAVNRPSEANQLIGPGYWPHETVQELLFSLIIVASLVLVLVFFGLYTLYRFRNPAESHHPPEPLSAVEQAECCGLDVRLLKDWHAARKVKVEVGESGDMEHYEVYPQEEPDNVIL